jgi:epoxyqueuosine reductase
VWAARRLLDAEAFARLAGMETEEDPTVRAEWVAAP